MELPASPKALSPRELDIVLAICNSETPANVAKRLGLSVKTIATYRARIIEKTGAKGNVGIALDAIRSGIFKIPDSQ